MLKLKMKRMDDKQHLTKEEIEAEGWKELFKNHYVNAKKEMFLKLYFGYHYDEVMSFSISIYNDEGTFFRGSCPNLDVFKTICKLLRI